MVCVVLLSAITSVFLAHYLICIHVNDQAPAFSLPQPYISCPVDPAVPANFTQYPNDHQSLQLTKHVVLVRKALILVQTQYSKKVLRIRRLFEAWRFDFKVEVASDNLLNLTQGGRGKFAIVVFENYSVYTSLDASNRKILDNYCASYKVGIIGFLHTSGSGVHMENFDEFSLKVQYNVALSDYKLNIHSNVWRVSRPGHIYKGMLGGKRWAVFHSTHPTYIPLSYAYSTSQDQNSKINDDVGATTRKALISAVHDVGHLDGIQRILFGGGLDFWMHHIMLMDCISYLSRGLLSLTLDRYIQIDIDDIFVGKSGIRIKEDDVEVFGLFFIMCYEICTCV